jgi:EAL domain-containing protein (putative c-di-GMP-specific phosphodiesterase class I)/FixJ family two-component response regulator
MKKTLLLVDDENHILTALRRVFCDEGYEIIQANNGKEALSLLEKFPVQVIISDQSMPVMTGTEFFSQVKKQYPDTIRIILSAHVDFESVKSAINDGAIYKYFNKPWDATQLRHAVEEAFLTNAQLKQKELNLIRLMNYAKLTGVLQKQSLISEMELQTALDEQQFMICYQPIVDIRTGDINTVEALLRWMHPTHGLLMPDQFINFCEETGFILPLGEWMMRSACRQLKVWHDLGYSSLSLAVNLSVRQFDQPHLLELIRDIFIEANLVVLDALKKLGILLSLDDFGTGYSSLSYLKLLPIEILKIDKSFIKDIPTDKNSAEIVVAIIALAKNLNLSIVAEGVENDEQLAFLKLKQCDFMQGYLFSKAISADECTKLLAAHQL